MQIFFTVLHFYSVTKDITKKVNPVALAKAYKKQQ